MQFLDLNPKSFGLDISELSLKLAMIEKAKKRLSLVSFGLEKIKPGVIEKGEIKNSKNLTESIKKAVKGVQGRQLNTKYVAFSLPEVKSFLQVIQLPKMSEKDLESAVRFEAENYIPLPIEKVYLDFQKIKPIYGKIDHIDVLIASLPKETVDPYISCLKEAGLQPSVLEIECQAIARALIKNEVSTRPILLIDFGETRTSFIIWAGRCVHFTSTIPISSQKVTQSISKGLNISISEAEKMKTKYGFELRSRKSGKERKKVFEALVPIMTDLVEQIKNCLDYYQTHAKHEHLPPDGKGIEKILLCGGGVNLKGLSDFLASELKVPVTLGNPWINIGEPKKKPLATKELLAYTTALGLALGGANSFL